MKNVKIAISIPENYYNMLEELREKSTWTRALLIREALKDFLEKYYTGELK